MWRAAPARCDVAPRPPEGAQKEKEHPWLGLSIEKGQAGVRVREVMPDSPCASVDVHPGDEVLALDSRKTATPSELIAAVQKAGVGARVELSLRGPQGQERKTAVTLGPRPELDTWQKSALLGKAAPDFTPKVLSGPPMTSLGGLRGEVVLLDFYASWCGPCMRAMPVLDAMARRLSGKGLRVVGVSAETAEIIGRVTAKHQPSYTMAMDDGEAATHAYRIHAFPTLFVIDRKGFIKAITSDPQEAERAVTAALGAP